jgi:hypothetical protein
MRKLLIVVMVLVTAISVAIPIILYLTYPTEGEVVEQVVENIYKNPLYQFPRFVPGVIGCGSSVNRELGYRGIFHVYGGNFNIVVTDRGQHVYIVLLPWYRCANGRSFIIPRESLVKYMDKKEVVVIGSTFRTPKGLIFVPLEIKLENISCVYLRKR